MKNLFIVILCFVASKVFSQNNNVVFQEKSSEWITVTSTVNVAKPRTTTTTVKKKTSSTKPVTPKKNTQEDFDKTNSQVNRFKKEKKG